MFLNTVNELELKLYSMSVKLQPLAGCDVTSASKASDSGSG